MQKEKLLISACLLGIACRYDGNSKTPPDSIEELSARYELIPICPEIYGGLPTPRTPSERIGDKVLMKDGTDVTDNYHRGAESTLAIAKVLGAKKALLKERSPSCGTGSIYDGNFSGRTVPGMGVCAELLSSHGILLFSEDEIYKLI